jgi:hypothetical protein
VEKSVAIAERECKQFGLGGRMRTESLNTGTKEESRVWSLIERLLIAIKVVSSGRGSGLSKGVGWNEERMRRKK